MVDIPCSNVCKGAHSYHEGIKGDNADITKLLFVLNKPDKRVLVPTLYDIDYEIALSKSRTGKVLIDILKFCNLTINDVYITNLFKCVLPGDRVPRKKEYEKCVCVLEQQIKDFKPKKIIMFGRRAYEFMFPEHAKKNKLEDMVGQILCYDNIPSLISYHPGMLEQIFKKKQKREHYEKIKDFLISD